MLKTKLLLRSQKADILEIRGFDWTVMIYTHNYSTDRFIAQIHLKKKKKKNSWSVFAVSTKWIFAAEMMTVADKFTNPLGLICIG